MAVVIFDDEDFREQFPKFADDSEYPTTMLEMYFDMACGIVGNTDGRRSLAPYAPKQGILTRERLLYLATCHFLQIFGDGDGSSAPGRVASASQGSVSTSFDLIKTDSASGDWWCQTQCGALFWMLIQANRYGGMITTLPNRHPYG